MQLHEYEKQGVETLICKNCREDLEKLFTVKRKAERIEKVYFQPLFKKKIKRIERSTVISTKDCAAISKAKFGKYKCKESSKNKYKYSLHEDNTNLKFQCDYCKKNFFIKFYWIKHVLNCFKQFDLFRMNNLTE